MVSDLQRHLVQNVSNFSKLAATINDTPEFGPSQDDVDPATLPFDQQKYNAIQLLSNQTIRYLETWDNYARETLYVSGGEDVQSNEIQLVAYQAGRAMASLSWGVTTTVVPIENALNYAPNADPSTNQDAKSDPDYNNTWRKSG